MLRTAAPLSALFATFLAAALQDPVNPDRVDVLDFEGLPAGTVVDEVTGRHGLGPVLVQGVNPRLGSNAALLFDSAHPTGGDDDLGTPNEDFGGPGVGDGGGEGSEHENRFPQGNLLVVADDLVDLDGDGLVDDPGDTNDPGAALELDFVRVGPVTVRGMTVIDLESADARVDFFDAQGELLASTPLPTTGDNGVARVAFDVVGVTSMVVHLGGSAAIDDVVFARATPGGVVGFVWEDLDGDGLQDPGEPGIPGVELQLDGPVAAAVEVTTDAFGRYDFGPLAPGAYVLEVVTPPGLEPSPCDVGDDDSVDSDCSPFALEVQDGRLPVAVDFGFTLDGPDGVIGDLIFNDLDGDNLQGPGDEGIAGALLSLFDSEGNLLVTTLSDAAGHYEFTGLADGVYMVTVQVNLGQAGTSFGPVICDVGGDDNLDSECGPECVVLGNVLVGGDSQDVSVDFGFGECGECAGKVDALSLRYLGPGPVLVEVVQKDGALVFSDVLETDDKFSFFGVDHKQTFGPWIDLYVDGVQVTQIHTSCSLPIEPGMVFADFLLLAGTSRVGGVLCPE